MTTTASQPASARQSLLARHPLVSYFLIAFAFTWTLLFSVLLTIVPGLRLLLTIPFYYACPYRVRGVRRV
jgi:hypothetical protein